jgi:hypothetical protein
MRTRKEGKGYLRGDSGGQPGADAPDALKLVDAAERAEGITVDDDPCRQRRPDASKRLDFGRGSDVEIDNRGNRRRAVRRGRRRVEFRASNVLGSEP